MTFSTGRAPLAMVSLFCAAMFAGCAHSDRDDWRTVNVRPTLETAPVLSSGDAADDVAIWVHPRDASRSRFIASDKRRGIVVYDIDGEIVQELAVGGVNNIDVIRGFPIGDRVVDLALGSALSGNSIAIYRIDIETGTLEEFSARPIVVEGNAVYGLCAAQGFPSEEFYVFVTTVNDEIHQFRLFTSGDRVDAELIRRFNVGGHAEGMVVDAAHNALFVAEEDVGIWRYEAEPAWALRGKGAAHPELSSSEAGKRALIGMVGRDGLAADVEGLAIYPTSALDGYLLASSQGDSTFVVFDRREPHTRLMSFRVIASGAIDGVSSTDGIEVCVESLGARFPRGVLVVQDDENDGANQNFKVIDWRELESILWLR